MSLRFFVSLTVLIPLTLFVAGCDNKETLFRKLSSNRTGITFNNAIIENDSINPIDLEFLYNGGGVAAGDFNNDGLTDLYFTASLTSNRLYMNRGGLVFEDVTEAAGVTGEGRWANAASVVDINADGLDDIYVCNTIKSDPGQRRNLLYVNMGAGKNGVPVFKEMARAYNIDDTSLSVHAAFFDYDNDGDLDMYLVTTKLAKREGATFMNRNFGDTSRLDYDKLFRNDWNDALDHPYFTDVSKDAGIMDPGFGLGVAIADINSDGWKDIYVTNDFFGSDLLYINNGDGTFTDKVNDYFRHTSQNAMGNDIADINNDGLPDIIAVDMNPEDNYRKKKNMSGNNYYIYQSMMAGGMMQYVRNTLQINQGPTTHPNDSVGDPVFSDLGFMAGVAETDWSWAPTIADFDNDGNKDIIITNGYPRDVTDHDFSAFMRRSDGKADKQAIIDQIPQVKVPNYGYRNEGALKFRKVTAEWGLGDPSFSNGAVYADLDNDGDLDYIVNNINHEAFVYENTINGKDIVNKNWLTIEFDGPSNNKKGLGASVTLYYEGGKMQAGENYPFKGYLSTVESRLYFGMDTIAFADSVVVNWPGGMQQVLRNIPANETLKIHFADARPGALSADALESATIFTDVADSLGIRYRHTEPDFIDFNEQRLLPHKLSEYGPGLAAGDLDGNGLDDLLVGGTGDLRATIFFQQAEGAFIKKEIPYETGPDARRPENLGILIFDADGDGNNDVYFANGSNEYPANSRNYRDRLYVNDGKGNLTISEHALPENYASKGCVKAADFDRDGDLDLFIGGRVIPGKYPLPVNSFIYRNDSEPGFPKFTDVTAEVAPSLREIGMICDGLFTDFDNDGWTDLVLAGEWMAVRFLKNTNGVFKDVSENSGVSDRYGWWNSIAGADLDNDGDIDYVVGNLGRNSFYRASSEHPVKIYAKDFDNNKTIDLITTVFLPDEQGRLREYPAQTRDDHVEQVPLFKKKFLTYKEFGKATINDLLSSDDLRGAHILSANYMNSAVLRNDGSGKFELIPLPEQAQVAPLYGLVIDDFDGDGNLDIAATGNDYGTEVGNGRYDALNGLVMLGKGDLSFRPLTILQSGLYIPGNGKSLVKVFGKNDYYLAATQNRGPLKVFRNKTPYSVIPLGPLDRIVEYTLRSGKRRREEIYYGNSFISQSSRFATINSAIESAEVIGGGGEKRMLFSKQVTATEF